MNRIFKPNNEPYFQKMKKNSKKIISKKILKKKFFKFQIFKIIYEKMQKKNNTVHSSV